MRRLGWEARLCSVRGNVDFGDFGEERWGSEVLRRCERYCSGGVEVRCWAF